MGLTPKLLFYTQILDYIYVEGGNTQIQCSKVPLFDRFLQKKASRTGNIRRSFRMLFSSTKPIKKVEERFPRTTPAVLTAFQNIPPHLVTLLGVPPVVQLRLIPAFVFLLSP